MPDRIDKDTLKDYADASRDVLESLKSSAAEYELHMSFLKDIGAHHRIIESVQSSQLSTQSKINALEANMHARLVKISSLRKDISDLGTTDIAKSQELTNQLMNQEDHIRGMQEEYAKLHKQRSGELVSESLGINGVKKITSELSELWSSGGPMLIGIVLAVKLFKFILDTFNEIDKAAADFRKSLGITREFTKSIDDDARSIQFEYGAVGVTAKHVYESVKAIAESFGTALSSTKRMKIDMALMSQQLGISASTSAEFLRTMASVAGTTAESQLDVALFAAKLSQAADTNLDEVMKDVANATKSHYTFMSRSPIAITKAAVEAKRLGTSLTSAASSAEKLIDFTSSVRDEMEASVLMGKSMNLQKARDLSFARDLKGLNEEILKIAKESSFEERDPITQKAIATALGKSADELGKMLQADKEMDRLNRSTDAGIRNQLKSYNSLTKATAQRVKDEAQSERQILSIKNNSARIESIQQSWKALTQRIAESFLPIIDNVLGAIANTLSFINKHTYGWGAGLAAAVVGAGALAAVFFGLSKFFSGIGAGLGKGVGAFFKGTASGIRAMASPSILRGVINILALSASLIPLAFAMKLMDGVNWKTFFIAAAGITALAIGAAILGPILPLIAAGSLAIALLGASLIPFSAAMWIASKAIQNFASGFQVIVQGFKDLQTLSLIKTVSQVLSLTSALKDLAVAINSIPKMEFDKLNDLSVGFETAGTKLTGKQEKESGTNSALQAIKDEICAMRKDLASGGIMANVYIDSQLLSSQTDRTTRFTNGYGTNSPRTV